MDSAVRAVGDRTSSGWRTRVRHPAVIVTAVVVVVLVAGGATAWATSSSGNSGYRTTAVVHASIAQHLDLIGTVEPVSDATAAFQVGGQVTSVSVAVGDQVTAGQALASLDPTSLTQAVSSAQLSVEGDEAKLTEDEDSETSTSSNTGTGTGTATTTTTTVPSGSRPNTGSGANGQITQDQAAVVADQKATSADQQQEAADVTQADSDCGLNTDPPSTPDADCAAALAKVTADQQKISNDQKKVATDENTLAGALTSEQSSLATSSSSASTSASTSPSTSSSATSSSSFASPTSGGSGSSTKGASATGASSTGAASDSAEQIASDQGAIDSAQATLIEAQQALSGAVLASPIAGTVASVGLASGDTVSAHSSTGNIVIIGTHSYEVTGTLSSSQVTSVKVGYTASVSVDGTTGIVTGTVSQVGPVQSDSSGYSYPVVVVLPSSVSGLYTGSTAAVSITTSSAVDALAIPTSAVTTVGTRSTVLEMSAGTPVRKVVKVGLVGNVYTQVTSGLKAGDTVVLADLSTPVPASSNTTTIGGFGGGGFGGAGGGRFTGGGGGRFTVGGAGGGFGG